MYNTNYELLGSINHYSCHYILIRHQAGLNITIDVFYLRIRVILKWKTLLPHINFPKTTLVRCSV